VQSHIRVDVCVKLFPPLVQKILHVIAILFWVVFPAFIAYEGSIYVFFVVMHRGQTSPALHVPMWIPYLAISIGRLLMVIRLIQRLYYLFTSDKDLYETEETE